MQETNFRQWLLLPCRVDNETTHSHGPKLRLPEAWVKAVPLLTYTKKAEVIAAESYLVLWARTWTSLWRTLVETFRNLQADSAVDEPRTRPGTAYSSRCDSRSIGGSKAKAIPETEVDPSNVPAQPLWVVKLFWISTLTDGDVFQQQNQGIRTSSKALLIIYKASEEAKPVQMRPSREQRKPQTVHFAAI